MILHKEKIDVLGGFTVQREKEFGIAPAMVAHVVKTLIEMYSKPHTAVAREYIANAVDSHRQFRRLNPGATLPPIEVTTPTMLAPTFSVRDFGAGMTEDDTESLLSSFGSSGTEKRTSDEFVGGFGIGSKVGFAVADTYTYTVWHNGIKCIWICTLRADAKQAIQLIHKQPSDERSGVLVEVPIAEVDIKKVAEGISYTLRVLREQVLLDGDCVTPGYEVVDTPAGTLLRASADWSSLLTCGDFTYAFPSRELDYELRDKYRRLADCARKLSGLDRGNTPVLYALSVGASPYYESGTFRPTPNREDLIWDQPAIKRVNLTVRKVLEEAEKEKQLLASSARTPLDLLRALKAFDFSGNTVMWQGKPISFEDIPHYDKAEHVATVKSIDSRYLGRRPYRCAGWVVVEGLCPGYLPVISYPEELLGSSGMVRYGAHVYTLRQFTALEAEEMPEKVLLDKIQAFRSGVASANAGLPQDQQKTHTDYLLVIGKEQDRKDTLAKLSWVISSIHPDVLTAPPKPPRKPRQPRIAGAPAVVRVDSVSSKGWVMTSSSGLVVAKIPAPGRVVYGVGRPNLEITASLHAMHDAWDDVIPGFRESIIYFLTEEAEKRFLSKHKGYAPVKLVDAVVEWLNTWAMLDPGGTGLGIEMLWAYAPLMRLPYVVGGEVQIDPHGLFQTSDIVQFLSASRWHALPVPPTGNLAASRFLEFYLRRTWRAGYPRSPDGYNFALVRTQLLPAIYYCLCNGGIGVGLESVLTEDSKRMALKKVGLFVKETHAFVRKHPCVSYLFDACRLHFKDAEDFFTKLWLSLNR